MKIMIKNTNSVFGMANLNPQKSGLGNIIIWSDHGGVSRKVSHKNTPRVKLTKGDMSITVTISPTPKLLARNRHVKDPMKEFKSGLEYVGRNYDIFLKHFEDVNFSFDDEDLYQALRDRGEYK